MMTLLTFIGCISITISTFILSVQIDQCRAWNDTNSMKHVINDTLKKVIVHYERNDNRSRRQLSKTIARNESHMIPTVLSILPLDRFGSMIGQIMATSLKEMFNPNVGTKVLNIIETQAPHLLTSLVNNIYSSLLVPTRPSTNRSAVFTNKNVNKRLSNSSSALIKIMRNPEIK